MVVTIATFSASIDRLRGHNYALHPLNDVLDAFRCDARRHGFSAGRNAISYRFFSASAIYRGLNYE
jgi:hypothetical protein